MTDAATRAIIADAIVNGVSAWKRNDAAAIDNCIDTAVEAISTAWNTRTSAPRPVADHIAGAGKPIADAGEGFLTQLRRVNTDRYHAWVGEGEDAGILFDAAELGGEVGELLNVVKKLEREARGWRGSRAAPEDFADECADVLICLDKLARRHSVDLEAATIAKFNATSDKVGLPHKLVLQGAADQGGVREAAQALLDFIGDGDMRVYSTDLVVRDLRAALTGGQRS